MPIIQVALAIPKRQLFDYLCDDVGLAAGCRVLVPFGRQQKVGIVMGTITDPQVQPDKLKSIMTVLDDEAVISSAVLSLCQWVSQYYQHPIGEVLFTALPAALRKGEASEPPQAKRLASVTTSARTCDVLARARQQKLLWQKLQQGPQPLDEVKQSFAKAVIEGLINKGLARLENVPPLRSGYWQTELKEGEKPKANIQQALAISGITQTLARFRVHLLEGVTGSGKTEVYLQCIEPVLKQGKQVLVLVPEIGLTPQTVQRFENRFGVSVGVLHSNLSDTERLRVWQQAGANHLGIIIGTRSAIYTPLMSPGMIIVDEEHDGSFKQQEGLRYHARDVAIMRARQAQIPIVLGTATPSLETLNNALQDKYHHHELTSRAGNASLTHQQVLDITNQQLNYGLASGMIERIRQHLSEGNQVLLFINRRGYAPAMLCHSCGYVAVCRRCEKPYTLHKQLRKMQCHHCGGARPIPPRCEECGSAEIEPQGLGTEQLEQGLAELFPEFPALRIDSDTTRGKNRLHDLLDKVNQNEYSLLVGTQILSKGHHFPNVTLVVILEADGALFSADYRAAEHLAQLLTQLAGRAGRASKPGEMWLQTHQPGHPLIQDLIHNGYHHFARHALLERKHAHLPPYYFQALFRAEATHINQVNQFLNSVAEHFAGVAGIGLIGPLPAIMEKRQGRYRMQLLLQTADRALLQRALWQRMPYIEQLPESRKVRWAIDVDPQDFI